MATTGAGSSIVGKKRARSPSDAARQAPEKVLKQAKMHVYKSVDMPFSVGEKSAIEKQAFRAALSANLAFRVFEDPEVLELFRMMRSDAPRILPSAKILSGRLLDGAAAKVDADISAALCDQDIGLTYESVLISSSVIFIIAQ